MSVERVVVDTSALVDFAKGVHVVADALVGLEVHISIITEIEFLSWPGLADARQADAHAYLSQFSSNGIGDSIRDKAAMFKRVFKLKLPDAVIAATALHLNAPLITRDNDFKPVAQLIELRLV